MDEEHEMVPLDDCMRGSLDAVRTPPERGAGHRRFGAGRQHQQQYSHDSRSGGGNNSNYHHPTTTSAFERVAESISVRSHHHRTHRDDDVGNFNFGDDNEVRRQQEHARMQQRNGSHRLGSDNNHHYSSTSISNAISNSSNGVGSSLQQGKYVSKPRASGAPITPGASFTVPEQQRLSNKYMPPPSKPDSFLTNLMNVSKSSKAGARPTGAVRIPIVAAAPQASVLSASPSRQRLRATTSVLELGSAPSPSRSSQQTSQSATTSARTGAAAASLGWRNTWSRNPASSIVVTREKPRINLTPNKRPFPEEQPTRTSPRTRRLVLGRDSSLGYSSSVTRNNRDTGGSAEETSSNARSDSKSASVDGSSTISSILRRTTRLGTKTEKKTEGTADQPIDLDSDSDVDSPDNKAKKSADPPPRAKAKRRAAPTRKLEPHWEEVDLKAIKDGHIFEITEMTVWIGRLPCHADVYVRDDCVWICSIRSRVVEWNLMPHLQLHLKDFRGVHFYNYSDEKAPIPGDDLNAAERLMAEKSFVALKAECASTADQDVLKPFYEPLGSDDSKEYIVIEAPDYDRHGMCFGSLHTELQERIGALVHAIEDIEAGRAYLKALLREPYKASGSGTDEDRKRLASDYRFDLDCDMVACNSVVVAPDNSRVALLLNRRSDASEEEEESDSFDVQMTYPLPPCSSDIVTITRHDVSRLRPEQYLNDNIIDYYFKRLMVEEYAKTEYIQKNVLFLSSHFYSRLRMGRGSSVAERLEAGYKNVATWVTRTDFFSRSLIFVPINKELHALELGVDRESQIGRDRVSRKGKEGASARTLHVFVRKLTCCACRLDPVLRVGSASNVYYSFGSSGRLPQQSTDRPSSEIVSGSMCYRLPEVDILPNALLMSTTSWLFPPHARRFLQLEWENSCAATAKDKESDAAAPGDSSPSSPQSSYDVDKVVVISAKPPHQQNSFDCGVYILKYADVILENYLFHEAAFGDLSSGPISKDVIDNKLDTLITAKAFAPEDITQKRADIQEFITSDTHKYHDVMHAIAAEQKQNNENAAASETTVAGAEGEGDQDGDRTPVSAIGTESS